MKNICDYSNHDLFCSLGLYQEVSIGCADFIHGSHQECDCNHGHDYEFTVYDIMYSKQFNRLINFMIDTQNIYMFCPLCNKQMSFQLFPVKLSDELKKTTVECYSEDSIDDENFSTSEDWKMSKRIDKIISENRMFDKIVCCTHDKSHVYKFSYLLQSKGEYPKEFLTLTKIGQYPSINDFSGENIKSYQNLLKGYRQEYTKALGLFSAGIGIGSFVYLRRIFEFLLENAFKNAEAAGVLTREQYMKKTVNDKDINRRTDEKVGLLKDFLPEFMVSHCEIYGIISKGIHQLSEDECKEIFPVLQKSIALILDEEIARQKRNEDINLAEKALGKLNEKYKK